MELIDQAARESAELEQKRAAEGAQTPSQPSGMPEGESGQQL